MKNRVTFFVPALLRRNIRKPSNFVILISHTNLGIFTMEQARIAARADGAKQYASERECQHHGEVMRETRSAVCIPCRDEGQRRHIQKARAALQAAADELNRIRTQAKLDALERERREYLARGVDLQA